MWTKREVVNEGRKAKTGDTWRYGSSIRGYKKFFPFSSALLAESLSCLTLCNPIDCRPYSLQTVVILTARLLTVCCHPIWLKRTRFVSAREGGENCSSLEYILIYWRTCTVTAVYRREAALFASLLLTKFVLWTLLPHPGMGFQGGP